MRYSFRLAEVVGHVPDPRKRPGTIKNICEFTGLDRHQVASLLKNEVKYVPLDALSKLCEFLIDRGYATAEELPGRLFGVEPEHFWELLARRKRLVLCLGVRRGDEALARRRLGRRFRLGAAGGAALGRDHARRHGQASPHSSAERR